MKKRRGFSKARTASFQNVPQDIRHFDDSVGLMINPTAMFKDGDDVIVKRALVMVEGSHTDSKKRPHVFDKQRILQIVENTNKFLRMGGRVPWQSDHDKTQKSNLGDLEGELIVEKITPDNLPDKKAKHLIGKLGVFADSLVGKGQDVIADLMAGKIVTLSPGIDVATDTIREISATPTPAIVGLRVFNYGGGEKTLTWEDAEEGSMLDEELYDEYSEISEQFFNILRSITTCDESEIPDGVSLEQLYEEAKQGFLERVDNLFGVGGEEPEEEAPMSRPLTMGDAAFAMYSRNY